MATAIALSTNFPPVHKQIPTIRNSTPKSHPKFAKLDEALHSIQPLHSKSKPTKDDINAYSLFLNECISAKSFEHGQRLCLQLLLSRQNGCNDLLSNPTMRTKLITLYSVCERLDEARRIFQGSEDVPESVWVAMAMGYSRNGFSKEALLVYCDMLNENVKPRNFAFSTALKACATSFELQVGRGIHGQILKSRGEPDQVVYNTLLRLYTECGCAEEALQVFEEMPDRNVVSWNSLIAGFTKRDQLFVSLEIFRRMQVNKVGFSWVTLTTVLPVCARLTALNSGKEIHAQILKSREKPDVLVLNSLVNMYSKCGAMDYCRKVFDEMPERDLSTWNTLLRGYAVNGRMEKAMKILDEIISSGFRPDGITFTSLLSGCSHAGLTNLGQELFESMKAEYRISPTLVHYACLVDLLGRAGKLMDALKVIETLPMEPSGSMYGSLLNSCRLYKNIPLAEKVAKQLFLIEPNNPGNYVMLSNIYANAGLWEKVNMVREMMGKKAIRKDPGCSWMQIKDKIYTFVANGSFEFRNSDEYKKVYDELTESMKETGYVSDIGVVLHDVNEELKMEWVCGHSERIATMFGLAKLGNGIPVRVTKNLRVCGDCHSWMKVVSKVMKRLIVLRDTTRFHHFENGLCSCNDYW